MTASLADRIDEANREAHRRMLAGDPDVPASHVPRERTVVHVDRSAWDGSGAHRTR